MSLSYNIVAIISDMEVAHNNHNYNQQQQQQQQPTCNVGDFKTTANNNNNNNMELTYTEMFNQTVRYYSSQFITIDENQSFISAIAQRLHEHWFTISWVLAIIFIAAFLMYLNRPFYRVKRLEEVGYISDGLHSNSTIAQNTRRRRMGGDLPPPFPNGWYCVSYSQDLKKGEVKEVFILGRALAVFRGEDGKAAVLDAYCPHMGANMAVGGVVSGCALQCPFHGWKFDHEGTCVEVPYSTASIPSQAKTKSWLTLERNSQILIWFHADDEPPSWEPREYEGFEQSWKRAGITENFVNCHIQEIPENGADIAHLSYLHSPVITSGSDIRNNKSLMGIVFHNWVGQWYTLAEKEDNPKLKHIACLELTHQLYLFGVRVPMFDFRVKAFQEGPALVYLTWEFLLGKGAFCQTLVPQEPMLLRVGHSVWTHKFLPNLVGSILMLAEVSQVDRDIMIWNNKRYISKPILVKEDRAVGLFRRWYTQFYSDGSADFGKKNNMDW